MNDCPGPPRSFNYAKLYYGRGQRTACPASVEGRHSQHRQHTSGDRDFGVPRFGQKSAQPRCSLVDLLSRRQIWGGVAAAQPCQLRLRRGKVRPMLAQLQCSQVDFGETVLPKLAGTTSVPSGLGKSHHDRTISQAILVAAKLGPRDDVARGTTLPTIVVTPATLGSSGSGRGRRGCDQHSRADFNAVGVGTANSKRLTLTTAVPAEI